MINHPKKIQIYLLHIPELDSHGNLYNSLGNLITSFPHDWANGDLEPSGHKFKDAVAMLEGGIDGCLKSLRGYDNTAFLLSDYVPQSEALPSYMQVPWYESIPFITFNWVKGQALRLIGSTLHHSYGDQESKFYIMIQTDYRYGKQSRTIHPIFKTPIADAKYRNSMKES